MFEVALNNFLLNKCGLYADEDTLKRKTSFARIALKIVTSRGMQRGEIGRVLLFKASSSSFVHTSLWLLLLLRPFVWDDPGESVWEG